MDGRYAEGAGNIVLRGSKAIFYDGEGRITSVSDSTPGVASVTYSYDGNGRRVTKTAGTTTTTYVYGVSGELVAEYANAPSPAVCSTCYLTADWLGSTRVVTNYAGGVVSRHDYLPFGEEVPGSWGQRTGIGGYGNSDSSSKRFTGQERDSETGLDYFGARYYSGAQGRFTSPDAPFADQHPEDPQSWNLYGYVRNNPLIYTDPTGGYLCGASMTDAQCDEFEAGRKAAQGSADKLKERYGAESSRYINAQRAIDAYGARGVDNGVSISVRPLEDASAGGETRVGGNLGPRTADNPNGQNIVVGLRPVDLAKGGAGLSAVISHEGSHVADGSDWVASGFAAAMNPTAAATERRAYLVDLDILGAIAGVRVPPFNMGGVLVAPGFPAGINGPQIDKFLRRSPLYAPFLRDPAFDRGRIVRR